MHALLEILQNPHSKNFFFKESKWEINGVYQDKTSYNPCLDVWLVFIQLQDYTSSSLAFHKEKLGLMKFNCIDMPWNKKTKTKDIDLV